MVLGFRGWENGLEGEVEDVYCGFDPRQALGMVLERQGEVRTRVRREAEARRVARPSRGRSPAAFKLWRLHVMVWLEDVRGA